MSMSSSVESEAQTGAKHQHDAGQKEEDPIWMENQCESAGFTMSSIEEEPCAEVGMGKYHADNSSREDVQTHPAGTQVTISEECSSSSATNNTPSAFPAPSVINANPISQEMAGIREDEISRTLPTANTQEPYGQFEAHQGDSRRAYWKQNNHYPKMTDDHAPTLTTDDRPSRGSTPSPRNASPSSDVYRRAYQQYGTPFSSSTSTPMFMGVQQRPNFVPTAPQPARHHPPFPFFANPFMVPFAPHLPQATNQQSPLHETYTPEEWNTGMAGVRRNPDSGGFYLHPQYYHELLQQYLRNMSMADVEADESSANSSANEDAASVKAQNEDGKAVDQVPQQRNVDSRGVENDTNGPNYDNSRHDSQLPTNREAVGLRLAGQSDTPRGDNPFPVQEIATEYDRSTNESVNSATGSVDTSVENAAEGKVTRPGTLQLGDNQASDIVESDQVNRTGAETENPAMVLIKKQISEIEKQILRKAQNQNIRKMDAKEIEAFLLEQQRTFEANLFESTTNTGAWPQTALPWLQHDAMNWERAGAVADALARQQFEPMPDQRSLYELAAAAVAAADQPNVSAAPQLSQPNAGFMQPHFPQAGSAFVPPTSMYPAPVPWPPAPFYPGAPAGFGYPAPTGYFSPNAGHLPYGGAMPQYVQNAQFAAPIQPPVLPQFGNGMPSQLQQRNLEQEAAIMFSQAQQMMQKPPSELGTDKPGGFVQSQLDNNAPQNPSPTDENPWKEAGDEHYNPEHLQGDEPVESYVRKMKREEERIQRERSATKDRESAERSAADSDTPYNETDTLLDAQRTDSVYQPQNNEVPQLETGHQSQHKKGKKKKEVMVHEPAVLIEGVLFRARYLGSTQLICDGRPTKATRMMQAQEAVSRIKAPDGEPQPSTDVDLFISTEKIMVLNTDLQRISDTDVRQDIMMDHPLRTISYIADIGELVVLMARRVSQSSPDSPEPAISRTPKVICHVFESEEAQFIAQSIGQAFQVAYMEFLRANGIDDPGYLRDVDYQEVLNQQEIFGEELEMFARKETQKDVVIPKQKNEILGVVIVESGWGSMLPTCVIANLMPGGPAARSNNLNIGDHVIAVNGISFVGLPLSTCQTHIRNVRHLTAVKVTVVHTPPVVEVRIKRPDTKYQLGFSVQNGVICSLLRGGIAERGGVRVGHRIIEINSQSVVAVPHEKIVTMLATAVGEIQMKTMPTSMFRLLTGQEAPNYI